MSVITIIGVPLDYARSTTACAMKIIINRIPCWGYASNSSSSIEVTSVTQTRLGKEWVCIFDTTGRPYPRLG